MIEDDVLAIGGLDHARHADDKAKSAVAAHWDDAFDAVVDAGRADANAAPVHEIEQRDIGVLPIALDQFDRNGLARLVDQGRLRNVNARVAQFCVHFVEAKAFDVVAAIHGLLACLQREADGDFLFCGLGMADTGDRRQNGKADD